MASASKDARGTSCKEDQLFAPRNPGIVNSQANKGPQYCLKPFLFAY